MASDEEKAAEYIARTAELWKGAAEADELVDRDALIKAAESYERMAQRILQRGAANHAPWRYRLRPGVK